MKKLLKLLIVIVIISILAYQFLLSDFNPMFKDESFISLTESLKNAREENLNSIAEIDNKIYKKIEKRRCDCESAVLNIGPYRHGFSLTKKLQLLKVQREFTESDCLKFELLNTVFLNKIKGIQETSKIYFNKTIEELNEEEKITFIVMLKNPSLYNPLRRKEKVENWVRIYSNILHEQNGK